MISTQDILSEHQAAWDALDWNNPPEWTPLWRARSIVLQNLRIFSDPFDAIQMIFIIEKSIEEAVELFKEGSHSK